MRTFEAWKAVYRDATCHAPSIRALVYDSANKGKAVKNLGWLLRHWGHVESIEVGGSSEVASSDCFMVARMRDRSVFLTPWGSRAVCRAWIKRPSFRGLPLSWFGEETVC